MRDEKGRVTKKAAPKKTAIKRLRDRSLEARIAKLEEAIGRVTDQLGCDTTLSATITQPAPYTPQFGDVVEYEGHEWEVVSRGADRKGTCVLLRHCPDSGWLAVYAATEDITLIRRP